MRGGLTITADAPAACAARLYSMHKRSPSALVPATTGTRPFTCAITVSRTVERSASVRRATSLVTPSAVKPLTPAPMYRSTTRRRLSKSNAPSSRNGVGRTENTPASSIRWLLSQLPRIHPKRPQKNDPPPLLISTVSARGACRSSAAFRAPGRIHRACYE